jgi:hypothetical protein
VSLRPTAIAEKRTGGLYVVIDDPETVGALLLPCPFAHRRVVAPDELDADYQLHPARCSGVVPLSEVKEALLGERAAEAAAKVFVEVLLRRPWDSLDAGHRGALVARHRSYNKAAYLAAFPSTDSEGQS